MTSCKIASHIHAGEAPSRRSVCPSARSTIQAKARSIPRAGAGGVGGLVAVSIDGDYFFPGYDNNGNIIGYWNEDGEIVAEYAYDAFGNTIYEDGDLADFFPHRFSTKYYDAETDLYYYGYRYYSPSLGRWISRDPIEEKGAFNIYSFCKNSPLDKLDHLGMFGYSINWRLPTSSERERIRQEVDIILPTLDYYIGQLGVSLGQYTATILAPNRSALYAYEFGKDLSNLNPTLISIFDLKSAAWPQPQINKMLAIQSNLIQMRRLQSFDSWRVSKRPLSLVWGLTNLTTGRIGLNCSLFSTHSRGTLLRNTIAHEASHRFAKTRDILTSRYSETNAEAYGVLLENPPLEPVSISPNDTDDNDETF